MTTASTKPRAIFFGTPEFAATSLRALVEIAEVVLVITQPDRPAGRGMKLSTPPVKRVAEELGLPVLQPTKVRTPEFAEQLVALRADVAVVVAYGRILPSAVLRAPRLGCVNVHGSLLPKLRGAAPVQWAIVNGERETGVCLMQMDEGMDTGAVLSVARTAIDPQETGDALMHRLAELGAELLQKELPRFVRGELVPAPQDHAHASYAPVLEKKHGALAWHKSARELHDLVRGLHSWPGAFTFFDGKRVKVLRARVLHDEGVLAPSGQVLSAGAEGIAVACGRGALLLLELQPEGKKSMPAAAFAAGQRLSVGARFGALDSHEDHGNEGAEGA